VRLKDKIAIVVGAGQTPGDTIGNGRATAVLFARHGAKVLLVDRHLDSARETAGMIEQDNGDCQVLQADVRAESDGMKIAQTCMEHYGRIDILHNNVGIGAGDGGPTSLSEENWDRIFDVNLKGMFLTCKHVVPIMRAQRSGNIINISSVAAIASSGLLAYKASKAGVIAFTQSLANSGARYGIRANCILPGLMNTPMAIEVYGPDDEDKKNERIAQRNARVPLGRKMGTAWDVAYAALFLASDEAKFITGVNLPVDGGQSIQIG
jgi:NAD(P)-dependent dehydrogenase (short-subunit alcohol dehydrogenase family)